MDAKRTIKAKKFLRYLRSGYSKERLMEKFSLTADELYRVVGKLIAAGLLPREAAGDSLTEEFTDQAIKAYRRTRRCYPTYYVPVYDLDNLGEEGQLLDINETGLRVSGLTAEVGQKKSLIIQADELGDVHPFCVDGVCRWKKVEEDGKIVAGFEVHQWPSIAPELLAKIMTWLTMCEL
jgi:hypothetical protein